MEYEVSIAAIYVNKIATALTAANRSTLIEFEMNRSRESLSNQKCVTCCFIKQETAKRYHLTEVFYHQFFFSINSRELFAIERSQLVFDNLRDKMRREPDVTGCELT